MDDVLSINDPQATLEASIEEDIQILEEELGNDLDISTNIPKIGKFYVFKVDVEGGQSRLFFSPLNATSTFSLKKKDVPTKYGVAKGTACSMQLKFLTIAPDYKTERPIGVYQVISSDNFVKSGIKVQDLRDSLTKQQIDRALMAIEYNTALRLKNLLRQRNQQLLTMSKMIEDMKIDPVQQALEMSDWVSSHEELGIKSTKENLERAHMGKVGRFLKDTKWLILIGLSILALWAFFPLLLKGGG